MTQYATFTEENDNEGETWRFYIPFDRNEGALARLYTLVERHRAAAEDEWQAPYSLSLDPIDESVVNDRLSLADDTDYMPAHNKLEGRLDFPEFDAGNPYWFDDTFYKGKIEDHMVGV